MAVPRFRVTERQVLMVVLGASFAVLAAAFLMGRFGRSAQALAPTGQARIHWMAPENETVRSSLAYRLADYFDPSLMSLPSSHGFSVRLWQRSPNILATPFEPAPMLAWLQPTTVEPGGTLLEESTLAETVNAITEKLPASEEGIDTNASAAVANVVTQSILRIEGALESRTLRFQPHLPAFSAGSGLKPTQIRLAVAPDGRVRYVALERSCGSDSVDAQALDLSRQLIFDPVTSADPLALTWGRAKFYWATHN
jgi:hypothetical protein